MPSQPDHPPGSSIPTTRREMRKALVRLRMATHREALRREAQHLLNPVQRMHGVSDDVMHRLKNAGPPLWAGGAAVLLALLTRRRRRKGKDKSSLAQLIRLGVLLTPVIKMAWSHRPSTDKPARPSTPPATPPANW